MATYNNTKKTYYSISGGKLKRFDGPGVVSEFTGIDGFFKGISERAREINGERVKFTDFNFVDGEENFCVSCQKYGGPSNNIVRCLVNVKDFSKKILIEVWQSSKDGKNFTNVSVKQDGERVPWVDIPKAEEFRLPTGEVAKSTRNRDEAIDKMIEQLNASAHSATASPVVEASPAGLASPDEGFGVEEQPPFPSVGDYPAYVPNSGE